MITIISIIFMHLYSLMSNPIRIPQSIGLTQTIHPDNQKSGLQNRQEAEFDRFAGIFNSCYGQIGCELLRAPPSYSQVSHRHARNGSWISITPHEYELRAHRSPSEPIGALLSSSTELMRADASRYEALRALKSLEIRVYKTG